MGVRRDAYLHTKRGPPFWQSPFPYMDTGLKSYFLGFVTTALDIDTMSGVHYANTLQIVVLYLGVIVIADSYTFHSGYPTFFYRSDYRITCYHFVNGRCSKVGNIVGCHISQTIVAHRSYLGQRWSGRLTAKRTAIHLLGS